MKWSWKIARFAGINVYIHSTFLLLVAWFGFSNWQKTGTVAAVIEGMLFIVLLFTCVVMHEFGHALTAKRFKVVTKHITLLPIGGVASMERIPDDPWQELQIAIAGPMVNIVIAGLLYFFLDLRNSQITEEQLLSGDLPLLYNLMIVNIFLVVFNMLPAYPTDGGRVLRALLAMKLKHHQATTIAAKIGQGFALLFGIYGFFYNPILVLIAVFLWMGASAENKMEQLKISLADITVADAMLSEFHILSPNDKLSKAIQYTLTSNQKHFPVGDSQQLASALTQNNLMLALQQWGEHALVSQATLIDIQTVPSNTPIEALLNIAQMHKAGMVAVSHKQKIVGIVDLENVLELIRIQNARLNKKF